MTVNLNTFFNLLQGIDNFSLQDILTILAFLGSGLAAVWVWFTNRDKQKLQAKIVEDQKRLGLDLERAKAEIQVGIEKQKVELESTKQRIQSELEDRKDNREFQQEQGKLEKAYQLSEVAVAQQMLMELLATAQEDREKSNEFVRVEVKEALDKIKADSSLIPKFIEGTEKSLNNIHANVINLLTYYRLLSGLLDQFRQDYERNKQND